MAVDGVVVRGMTPQEVCPASPRKPSSGLTAQPPVPPRATFAWWAHPLQDANLTSAHFVGGPCVSCR